MTAAPDGPARQGAMPVPGTRLQPFSRAAVIAGRDVPPGRGPTREACDAGR